ncbi:MAG: hypothetical protein CTY35_00030 [Methylotenera sp.]|uniref:hypothetical protein n=1 Tax=Methylotenera sp. TaxID=2051956 RepID=UPI000D417445|nr:hypothetical protein [Methylotenera sp.]PPC84743.1 MAG: hypothetical protein CTY38_00030 [Methylotenera sp.]PPD02102.1 MAG: hypothetical protein CTY35_00030 [Methylotenera sp.]
MINDHNIDPQSSRIDQLRSRLEAMTLPAAVSVIKTLNEQDRVALVMNQNTNGELYHHLLIQTWLNSECLDEYEGILLEALTLLEAKAFNIYDIEDADRQDALDVVINALTDTYDQGPGFLGSNTFLHIAERVSDLNRSLDYGFNGRIQATPLIQVTLRGNFTLFKMLIELGADLNFITADGRDCRYYAESTLNSHPEFYLNYRADLLLAKHDVRTNSKISRKL